MTDHALELFCSTCNRNVTMREVQEGLHDDHEFSAADRTAFQYVKQYLTSLKAAA